MSHLQGIVLGAFLVLLDQCAKAIVRFYDIKTGGRYLGVQLERNDFFSFALPVPNNIAALMSAAMISLLIIFLIKGGRRKGYYVPIVLIVSGGISNVLDRVFMGGVLDLVYLGNLHLNIADIVIITGVCFALFRIRGDARLGHVKRA